MKIPTKPFASELTPREDQSKPQKPWSWIALAVSLFAILICTVLIVRSFGAKKAENILPSSRSEHKPTPLVTGQAPSQSASEHKADTQLSQAQRFVAAAQKQVTVFNEYLDNELVLEQLAEAQAGSGDLSGAIQTAQTIKSESRARSAFDSVVRAQIKAGHLDEALRLAQHPERGSINTFILGSIARAQIKAGNLAAGRDTFALARSAAGNSDFLNREIVRMQAEAGDIAGALETTRMHTSGEAVVLAYCENAKIQAKKGDMQACRQSISRALADAQPFVNDKSNNQSLISWLVSAQLAAGDFAGACQTASSIRDDAGADTLMDISNAQAKAGDPVASGQTLLMAVQHDEATEHVFHGSIFSGRGECVLWTLSEAQIKVGNGPAAIQLANTIKGSYRRCSALIGIGALQKRVGDVSGSQKTFSLAMAIAQAITKEDETDQIAEEQAAAGDINDALQTALTIDMPYYKARILCMIAASQAETGDFEGAENTVLRLSSGLNRCRGYLAAASGIQRDIARRSND